MGHSRRVKWPDLRVKHPPPYWSEVKEKVEFDIHVTVHRDIFLTIKPTRCTNFSNLFLQWNSTCFGQFLWPSSGVFHCTHSRVRLFDPDPAPKLSGNLYDIPLLCVQWKTPHDGQRNCPKHVEFPSKNKFEKLVYLVAVIVGKAAALYLCLLCAFMAGCMMKLIFYKVIR